MLKTFYIIFINEHYIDNLFIATPMKNVFLALCFVSTGIYILKLTKTFIAKQMECEKPKFLVT